MTRITALFLLAAFTLARAAHADATYVDAKSGVSALVPEGFYGTAQRSADEQLLLKSDELEAKISVAAIPLLSERDFKRVVTTLEAKNAATGAVVSQVFTFPDRHLVGFVPAENGRFFILVTRPQGLAIGSFVGAKATDAHVAVVDAVAQSIQLQKTSKVAFDFPEAFDQMPTTEGGPLVLHDGATARYIILADDASEANAGFAQQAQQMLDKGLLGRGRPSVFPRSLRSPQTGVGVVDISYVSKGGDAMAGVMARVNLPARPMWVVVIGPGHEPSAQQDLANTIVTSMLRETKVASR